MAAFRKTCERQGARCGVCELSIALGKLSLEPGTEGGSDPEGGVDDQGSLVEEMRGCCWRPWPGRTREGPPGLR